MVWREKEWRLCVVYWGERVELADGMRCVCKGEEAIWEQCSAIEEKKGKKPSRVDLQQPMRWSISVACSEKGEREKGGQGG